MKNLIIPLLLLLFSCSKGYIQVFETSSSNSKEINSYWVYETDSIKITYEFWTQRGVMSFSVFNKLDKPIYIDWKKSSFITNNKKLNYWIDFQFQKSIGQNESYYYNGPLLKPGFMISEESQASNSISIKPESITFIPPESYYYSSKFYIWPNSTYSIDYENSEIIVVPRNDKPKRKTRVFTQNFTPKQSPLKFRNYIAISSNENINNLFYIDNEFIVKSITEMDYRHFRGRLVGESVSTSEYEKPFKKKNSFYIKIAPANIKRFRAN